MSAIKIIQGYARKSLTTNKGSGITTIPGAMQSEAKAGEIVALLQRAGIPMNQLDDFIRSEADVAKFLNIIEAANKPKVYSGQAAVDQLNKLFPKKGEVVQFPQKTSFKEQVEAMKKSGDIVDPNNLKKNDKVTQRDMFKDSNLNKEGTIMDRITTASNRIKEIQKEQDAMYKPKVDTVTDTITYIKTLEPVKAMKEANSIIARKGKYKDLTPEQSKKILQDTEDHIFQRDPDNLYDYDPEDMAKGGRIGFSGGRGIFSILKNIFKPKKLENTVEEFLSKRQFMKDIVGNTEKAKKARELKMLKEAMEEARENPGFKFKDVDIDKDIKPIFDKEIAESLKKNRKLNATGGRAGFYTGGITDVEPSLDDIGHGADAMNARTRLMSPGNQATTSTGLNYLLAEDNDNMRIPFAGGGDPKRRAFLKLLATLTGGAAAFKSGLLSLGEGGTKKAVTETVKQAAGSGGQVPPYFFKLVEKIKTLGDDVTSKSATQDRQVVKQYKDFEMTEDISTGEIQIFKKSQSDEAIERFGGENATEEVYMRYKPSEDIIGKNKKPVKTGPEYEENTSYISNNRENTGGILDEVDGVTDDVLKEVEAGSGNVPESFYTGPNAIKKADGGRIGFSAGGGKFLLSKLGINSTSRRFLEKVFGKEKFQTMIQNDPRMHRGMLEVVEMFRSKDKEGLKMYLQKFMPNMDDTEIEKFIVGDSGTEGIEGQLIRLGSGREYKNLINMKKEADEIRKLDDFDIEDVSKNAEGGRIGFSGGGIFRAIIAKSAAKKGLSVRDFIKATNYKGLPPEVRMYISADEFAKLKSGQQDLYENFIDMAKTRKSFQESVEGGKKTPAAPLFENLEKTMDEQSFVPKTVTEKDIGEMELMVKNRFNKDRKDNAQGGLQTMLGE